VALSSGQEDAGKDERGTGALIPYVNQLKGAAHPGGSFFGQKKTGAHRTGFAFLSSCLLQNVEEVQHGNDDSQQAVQTDNGINDSENPAKQEENVAQNAADEAQNQTNDQTSHQINDDADDQSGYVLFLNVEREGEKLFEHIHFDIHLLF
jgi:hypothetical protein